MTWRLKTIHHNRRVEVLLEPRKHASQGHVDCFLRLQRCCSSLIPSTRSNNHFYFIEVLKRCVKVLEGRDQNFDAMVNAPKNGMAPLQSPYSPDLACDGGTTSG